MEKLISFLKMDILVQKILLGLIFISLFSPINSWFFLGLFFFLLAIWQIISIILFTSQVKDKLRIHYLIIGFVYAGILIGLGWSLYLGSDFIEILDSGFVLPCLFVTPWVLSFWYLYYSIKTLRELEKQHFPNKEIEGILDSGEL